MQSSPARLFELKAYLKKIESMLESEKKFLYNLTPTSKLFDRSFEQARTRCLSLTVDALETRQQIDQMELDLNPLPEFTF